MFRMRGERFRGFKHRYRFLALDTSSALLALPERIVDTHLYPIESPLAFSIFLPSLNENSVRERHGGRVAPEIENLG
jgi:hypothetical protein